jgi:hypothetical protein
MLSATFFIRFIIGTHSIEHEETKALLRLYYFIAVNIILDRRL